MSVLNRAAKRLKAVKEQLQETAAPIRQQVEDMAFEGVVPNPLGDGSLLRIAVGMHAEEDAGGERMRLVARVSAPVMNVVPAPPDALRLEHQAQEPASGLPALVRSLPGGKGLSRRLQRAQDEVVARLPALQPSGEEVTTVFDIDLNRKKSVAASTEKGLVARAKDRLAVMGGPGSWVVDQHEEMVGNEFRGLMTIRSNDEQSPVDVVAKVGVELRKVSDD